MFEIISLHAFRKSIMKIAVAACDNHLNANISPVFEKSKFFLIIDVRELQSYESKLNPYRKFTSGADIFCAQLIVSLGADIVVTGSCTPNAHRILHEAHIRVFPGITGSVRESIETYMNHKTRQYNLV